MYSLAWAQIWPPTQRRVDALAPAGALAGQQGGQDAAHEVLRRGVVGDGGADGRRLAAERARSC